MRDELFKELLESAKEAMAIRRGEAEPSRVFEFDEVDVAEIREGLKLSQPKFAHLLGISVGTLRNWEQGRRQPEGPARALLRVAAARPDAVLEALAGPRFGSDPVPPKDPARGHEHVIHGSEGKLTKSAKMRKAR